MKYVLGVDPGYVHLGLAVLAISARGRVDCVWSESFTVGNSSNGMSFVKYLWPKLELLNKKYPFMGIGMETPPYIAGRPKVSALLWAVSSIIASWAYVEGVPLRHTSPISLKRATSRILGERFEQRNMAKKSKVMKAVAQCLAHPPKRSHENDAILAAMLLFTTKVPEDVPRTS